jgi:hypothetical protein
LIFGPVFLPLGLYFIRIVFHIKVIFNPFRVLNSEKVAKKIEQQIYVYCTKVKTLGVINFK